MMIKHIVLSSGLYYGLQILGVLHHLSQKNFYNIDNIQSIYGTSIGCYIGALLCLRMDWDTLIEYYIRRPWHKIIEITPQHIFNGFYEKGIFGKEFFIESCKNILLAKNLSLSITLKEFYDFSKIELHGYCILVDEFKLVDFSYKTHPDMELIQLIYQSCAYPFLFKPGNYKGKLYMDGAMINGYPIDKCLQEHNNDEILGIQIIKNYVDRITPDVNLFTYCSHIFKKLEAVSKNEKIYHIKNYIRIPRNEITINDFMECIKNEEERKKNIKKGKKIAKKFLQNGV